MAIQERFINEKHEHDISGLHIDGPIALGHAQISVLITEHDKQTWETNKTAIRKTIGSYQTIIPEYRPSEYKNLDNVVGIGEVLQIYADQNYLFTGVEDVCNEENKNVWVIDPAHNIDFAKFRLLLASPEETLETAALSTIAYNLIKPTRRKFLKAAGLVFASGAVLGGIHSLDEGDAGKVSSVVEVDFRHAIVAQHLYDLTHTQDLAHNPNTLVILPKGHWDEQLGIIDATPIKTYLLDNSLRESRFSFYKGLFGESFPALFEKRHYPPAT